MEEDPMWRKDDASDKDKARQAAVQHMIERLKQLLGETSGTGQKIDISFSLVIREGDMVAQSLDYTGILLDIKEGEEPYLVAGDVDGVLMSDAETPQHDIFIEHHDIMQVPLADIGIIVGLPRPI